MRKSIGRFWSYNSTSHAFRSALSSNRFRCNNLRCACRTPSRLPRILEESSGAVCPMVQEKVPLSRRLSDAITACGTRAPRGKRPPRQGTHVVWHTFRLVWPAVMITVGYATLHHRCVARGSTLLSPAFRASIYHLCIRAGCLMSMSTVSDLMKLTYHTT